MKQWHNKSMEKLTKSSGTFTEWAPINLRNSGVRPVSQVDMVGPAWMKPDHSPSRWFAWSGIKYFKVFTIMSQTQSRQISSINASYKFDWFYTGKDHVKIEI